MLSFLICHAKREKVFFLSFAEDSKECFLIHCYTVDFQISDIIWIELFSDHAKINT